MTAHRDPGGRVFRRSSRAVVFPTPRNPVTRFVGTPFVASRIDSILPTTPHHEVAYEPDTLPAGVPGRVCRPPGGPGPRRRPAEEARPDRRHPEPPARDARVQRRHPAPGQVPERLPRARTEREPE